MMSIKYIKEIEFLNRFIYIAPFVFDRPVMLIRDHNYLTRNRNSFKSPFPTVRTNKLNCLSEAVRVWNEHPNILKIDETVN